MPEFSGTKVALLIGDKMLVYRRDNKPGLRFANMWDFPGGGREGSETPLECVRREVKEEFNIDLKPNSIVWERLYPAMHDVKQTAYFFVAKVTESDIANIQFGNEGQGWRLMSVDEFLNKDDAVPFLKTRLRDYYSRQP